VTGLPPQDRDWDDLLGPPARPAGDPELVAEARHLLGLDSARRVRHGDMPDVDGLAEELGLA